MTMFTNDTTRLYVLRKAEERKQDKTANRISVALVLAILAVIWAAYSLTIADRKFAAIDRDNQEMRGSL